MTAEPETSASIPASAIRGASGSSKGATICANERLERRRLVRGLIEAMREGQTGGPRQRGETCADRFGKLLR